jgi:hypothetical protein
MVEEMMLLANVSVAEAIVKRFPSCSLLRRHQTPGGMGGGLKAYVWTVYACSRGCVRLFSGCVYCSSSQSVSRCDSW